MKIILSDGSVIQTDSATIIWEYVMIPGENEEGQLHVKVTEEGIVNDLWASREESLDHNIASAWSTVGDMVDRLMNEDSD